MLIKEYAFENNAICQHETTNMESISLLKIFFYAAIASVIVIWIYGFIILAKGRINTDATSKYVLLLGAGITLVSAIFWVGDTISAVSIEASTAKAIWVTLIAGILGTSLTVYKQQFSKKDKTLKIEQLFLLDEQKAFPNGEEDLETLQERNNANYTRGKEKILFCAIVSGFKTKLSGSIDIQIETLILDSNQMAASLLPRGQYFDPLHWKEKPYANSLTKFQEDGSDTATNNTFAIGMIEDIPSYINNGLVELRVTIIDNMSNLMARKTKDIVIN